MQSGIRLGLDTECDSMNKRSELEKLKKEKDLDQIPGGRAFGYALVATEPMKEHDVYNEILAINGVVEIMPVFGEYDLVVKAVGDDFNIVNNILNKQVGKVSGIYNFKVLSGFRL